MIWRTRLFACLIVAACASPLRAISFDEGGGGGGSVVGGGDVVADDPNAFTDTNSFSGDTTFTGNTAFSGTSNVFTSSNSANAINIISNGVPGGGVQLSSGGALNIRLNNISEGLVIYSSLTDTQDGSSFFRIQNDAPLYNDPLIWIEDAGAESNPFMRVDSAAPDFEMVNTSTDNSRGMGKWEPFASPFGGTQLQVNSRAYSDTTFERVAEWRMRQKGTALALYPTVFGENGNPTATNTAQLIWLSTNTSREWGMRGPQNPAASFYITWPSALPTVGSLLYMTEAAGERKMGWTPEAETGQCLKFNLGAAPSFEDCSSGAGSTYSLQYKDANGNLAGSGYFLDINQQQLLVTSTTGVEGAIAMGEAAANGASYVAFKASAALAGSTTWILPPEDGSAGDVLTTMGGGAGLHQLEWTEPSATFAGGTISGATVLNATMTLNQGFYSAVTAFTAGTWTALSTHSVITASATATAISTGTLPSAGSPATGQWIEITKVDTSTMAVVIVPPAGNTIVGMSTVTLPAYGSTIRLHAKTDNTWYPYNFQASPSWYGDNGDVASAAAGVATTTYHQAIYIEAPCDTKSITYQVGTDSGPVTFGIYNQYGERLLSTGPFASGGTGTITKLIPKVNLQPGLYYTAIGTDNATLTFTRYASNMIGAGMYSITSNLPLPASIGNPPAFTNASARSPALILRCHGGAP